MTRVNNRAEFSASGVSKGVICVYDFSGIFNMIAYLFVHVSIILALFILFKTSNCILRNFSQMSIKQNYWVDLLVTSLSVERTFFVSKLFSLVRVGASRGSVLPGSV